ncbi:trafficking protein particle complex subunit 1-like protein [Dinothrombium tinctorium]|uniref:Trafficking protein particle complex subunit n=1 Tax=Dinothrombium tinctorium TaxID=1965070 RepID=A0A3S3PK32_9ACAR|nr:trafficking protein particle complex subunit 1-like protein [Dinothrombium tinctorium]RWS16875.1 trafficking protein particle complex subunit 1-like protein [Dinothrombium tinctorium]
MIVYNLHIFDSKGTLLFSLNKDEKDENKRLLYGFLYSMKSFVQRITPIIIKDSNFFTFTTNCYQLIFMEMPTALKFALIVSPDANKSNEYYKQVIKELYRSVYAEYVVKNPLAMSSNGTIDSLLFRDKLVEFFNKM